MVRRLFGVEHLFAVGGTVVGNAKADTVRASEPRRVSAGGCVGHPLTSLCWPGGGAAINNSSVLSGSSFQDGCKPGIRLVLACPLRYGRS